MTEPVSTTPVEVVPEDVLPVDVAADTPPEDRSTAMIIAIRRIFIKRKIRK